MLQVISISKYGARLWTKIRECSIYSFLSTLSPSLSLSLSPIFFLHLVLNSLVNNLYTRIIIQNVFCSKQSCNNTPPSLSPSLFVFFLSHSSHTSRPSTFSTIRFFCPSIYASTPNSFLSSFLLIFNSFNSFSLPPPPVFSLFSPSLSFSFGKCSFTIFISH